MCLPLYTSPCHGSLSRVIVRTPPTRENRYRQIERFEPPGYAWFLYGTTHCNQAATALIVAKSEGFNSSTQ